MPVNSYRTGNLQYQTLHQYLSFTQAQQSKSTTFGE